MAVLYDNHGRPLDYLRLAVTDRCNLRCFYCMPEIGVQYLHKSKLLSYEEMLRLASILAGLGVKKVRITGGEPLVRQGLLDFLGKLTEIDGIEEVSMTTNGVLTEAALPQLWALGVKKINLSLDTLDRQRFFDITRRDEFLPVERCLYALINGGFTVKINAVVMQEHNIPDLQPLALLTEKYPVSVRFIEEMPFNGEGSHYPTFLWTHQRILAHLQEAFPNLSKLLDPPNSTAAHYRVPGFVGDLGIIAAFSRTFCGSCNRIRITAQGTLKTCLYDNGVLNLRDLLRSQPDDSLVREALLVAFQNRPANGHEAETLRGSVVSESMTTIGG